MLREVINSAAVEMMQIRNIIHLEEVTCKSIANAKRNFLKMNSSKGCLRLVLFLTFIAISDCKNPKDLEVHFLPVQGVGPHHVPGPHGNPVIHHGGPAAMPFDQFAKLFPMNLPPGAKAHVKVIHINPGSSDSDIANLIGDQLINSILSELSGGFHSEMLPLMHEAQQSRSAGKHPCEADLAKFCHIDHDHDHEHESEIHCLGLHAAEISAECSKEIQHSLPYICSVEISRFCPIEETMDKSIVQCLEDALHKEAAKPKSGAQAHFSSFDDDCREAVGTTRAILNKIKTQNVALVDRRTGEVIRSTAAFVSTSLQVGLVIAIVGVVGLLLFAIWTRDDETSIVKSLQRTLRSIKGIFKSSDSQANPSRTQVMEMKGGNSASTYSL